MSTKNEGALMATLFQRKKPTGPRKFYNRRSKPISAIVIHTTESFTDLKGDDRGAENVAEYLRTTTRSASYHTIVDSDSTVQLMPYSWTAFHCRRFNSGSLGLSFATQADKWETLPVEWMSPAIENGAIEAAKMIRYVYDKHGVVIPTSHISAGQARRGHKGFVGHGQMDPGRRHDPGEYFPWPHFLRRIEYHLGEPMPKTSIEQWQEALGVTVDDDFGPNTLAKSMQVLELSRRPIEPQTPATIVSGVQDQPLRDALKVVWQAATEQGAPSA